MGDLDPQITTLDSLPAAPKRIILHWTAGGPAANTRDLASYHYVIEQDGTVRAGVPVRRNMRQLAGAPVSEYAAHTRGFNSFSVGVSLAGMFGATEGGPFGRYPITKDQTRAMCRWVAKLCEAWDLEVTPETVFHHWEAEHLHGVEQAGKWDITVLPWDREVAAHEVGPLLREWVREAMEAPKVTVPKPELEPVTWDGFALLPIPINARSPAEVITPDVLRDALRDEGFSDDDIPRVARAMERITSAAEKAASWYHRARPVLAKLLGAWRVLRG